MWWLPALLHISSATEIGICMHSWASSFDSCTAGHTWISVETCNVHHSHISTKYHTSLSTAAINTHGSTKGSFVWKTFKKQVLPNNSPLHNLLPDPHENVVKTHCQQPHTSQTFPHNMDRTTKFCDSFTLYCLNSSTQSHLYFYCVLQASHATACYLM